MGAYYATPELTPEHEFAPEVVGVEHQDGTRVEIGEWDRRIATDLSKILSSMSTRAPSRGYGGCFPGTNNTVRVENTIVYVLLPLLGRRQDSSARELMENYFINMKRDVCVSDTSVALRSIEHQFLDSMNG